MMPSLCFFFSSWNLEMIAESERPRCGRNAKVWEPSPSLVFSIFVFFSFFPFFPLFVFFSVSFFFVFIVLLGFLFGLFFYRSVNF